MFLHLPRLATKCGSGGRPGMVWKKARQAPTVRRASLGGLTGAASVAQHRRVSGLGAELLAIGSAPHTSKP